MPNAALEGSVVSFPRASSPNAPELSGFIRQLSAARSLGEVMATVTHAVRTLAQADGATFVLRDGERCFYAEEDAISPLWKGRRFPMSDCVSGWCMIHGEPAAIPDIYKDPRVPTEAYRPTFVRSLVMVPVGQDAPVAALGVYWSEVREFETHQIDLLQTIANAAALSLSGPPRSQPAAAPAPAAAPPTRISKLRLREPSRLHEFLVRLRRDGVRHDSPEAYGFALICVAVAAVARFVVGDMGVGGLAPFTIFYPAVMLAMLVGGARAGWLAALVAGVVAYWAFLPRAAGSRPVLASDLLNLSLFYVASGLMVWMVHRYQIDVGRLKEEDARHLTLAREQHHRVLNATHVIEIIVRQSLKDDPAQARIITQRIRAGLADVDIRSRASRQPIGVGELLAQELVPFGLDRFRREGPDGPLLPPKIRSIVSLACHELATNALKYGALSEDSGRVEVGWRSTGTHLVLSWREVGGPLVKPPTRRGYGSVLLQRLVEAAGGRISIDYRPFGLEAELWLPLTRGGR